MQLGSGVEGGEERREGEEAEEELERGGERGAELVTKLNEISLLQELASNSSRRADLRLCKGHSQSDLADHRCVGGSSASPIWLFGRVKRSFLMFRLWSPLVSS